MKIPYPDRQLAYLSYTNRLNDFQHHGYGEEMKQYVMMQRGDPDAVEESQEMMRRTLPTGLSTDPLRNAQYLFVANITLATRFAIEGGMEAETAYNASDMYIRKMDLCRSEEEVMELHREMFTYFTGRMAGERKERVLSRDIARCVEYIEASLHIPIRIEDLAEQTELTPGYLSVLFKKETGQTFTDYVMTRRIETAKNMLQYSEYSAAEISEILAFSSQSYFIRCFRRKTGMTPRQFHRQYYDPSLQAALEE